LPVLPSTPVFPFMDKEKLIPPVPFTEYLTPEQVATILNVSEDTVTRQFENADGVIDLGTPATLHKRRKRKLRIPPTTLERFIAQRQVRTRR
jgi:Helix-turn-helix domain